MIPPNFSITGYKDIKIQVSKCGLIYTIFLNRPKKLNAVAFETMGEIAHFIKTIINVSESTARAVVLTGVGKHFTAGLDLNSSA